MYKCARNRKRLMMQTIAFSLVICQFFNVLALNEETRLAKHLLENYDRSGSRYVRPVANSTDALEVKHGISLQRIEEVDTYSNVLKLNLWENYEWKDILLQWKPNDFGGVESIRVPMSRIFQPDILLYNMERRPERLDTLAVVYHDGTVSWVPPARMFAYCNLGTALDFPQDGEEVNCPMKFGSWTYDGTKLNLTAMYDEVDTSTYMPHSYWTVVEAPAERHVQRYECCPEPYIDITYNITLIHHYETGIFGGSRGGGRGLGGGLGLGGGNGP